MTGAMQLLVLLGDIAPWRSMGSGLRGSGARFDSHDLIAGVFLLGAIALGVFALSRLRWRQERHRLHYSSRALFRSLCQAHALDRPSRRLLRQLARWQKLDHPARIFLEPHRFDPENLSPRLREKAAILHKLRVRIFARTAPNGGQKK